MGIVKAIREHSIHKWNSQKTNGNKKEKRIIHINIGNKKE